MESSIGSSSRGNIVISPPGENGPVSSARSRSAFQRGQSPTSVQSFQIVSGAAGVSTLCSLLDIALTSVAIQSVRRLSVQRLSTFSHRVKAGGRPPGGSGWWRHPRRGAAASTRLMSMEKQATATSGVSSPGGLRPTPTVVLGITVVLSALALGMLVVAWGHLEPSDAIPAPALAIAAPFFAFLGWLIVRRTTNVIGWLLLGEGVANSLMLVTSLYAVIAAAHGFPASRVIGTASAIVLAL